jgi:hypothetical protein
MTMKDIKPTFTLLAKEASSERRGEPVVVGIPLARKFALEAEHLALLDAADREIPCDVTALDRWPDGSVRWALLAFRAESHGEKSSYTVRSSKSGNSGSGPQEGVPRLRVNQQGSSYVIDVGPVQYEIGPGEGWPVRNISKTAKGAWLAGSENGLHLLMEDGGSPRPDIRTVEMEYCGPLRAVAYCKGSAPLNSGKRLEIDWRLEFFAGLPVVIVQIIIRNPNRAFHPDGYWELGDPGSALLREAAFRLNPEKRADGFSVAFSIDSGAPFRSGAIPFEIYQDSSGGENWQNHNHVNRNGKVPVKFRGYRCSDKDAATGYRATPVVAIEASAGTIALATRQFWQNFPQALEVSDFGISYGLFPRQWEDLHELQGGEQKTHRFALSFGPDGVMGEPLEWFRNPLVPCLDPGWVARTEAIPYFTPAQDDRHKEYISLVNSAIEGNDAFEYKRAPVDEYGWRNFGDVYADHEAVYAENFTGSEPLVSHYNNQYDQIAGLCFHWMRSGDPRWWPLFNELASHVIDIDIYHTDEDKAAYNHGLFWHTFHYVDAGRSTHRSYPRVGKSNGGGPSNEHIYATGLMLHYFITGNTPSKESAVGLAQFIIDADDGSKTVFKWLSRGYTGLASKSRTADYHGPGRGSGNALIALLDGYRLTRDPKFLQKAEQLIQRVSHPEQNIESLTLLDAENRWFYTMFLQGLGKYLDYKDELQQWDAMYGYARATLLHYARWMAENEYPFLEKPKILEYPTETWAAQDLRKSEVFKCAWLHASGKERERFAERAQYFFQYAIQTLAGMKTRTLCRPVALLLAFGWSQTWFESHPEATRKEPASALSQWPPHRKFMPQKEISLRRAKIMLAAGFSVLFLATIVIVSRFF